MNFKSTHIVFLFLLPFLGLSQDLVNSQTLVTSGLVYSFDKSDKSIQGTPYLEDNFSQAKTSASENKIFNIKYNLVSDEMEVENEKSGNYAINKNIPDISITFLKSNNTYQVFNYLGDSNNIVRGYFILLSNSKSNVALLLKQSKKFNKAKPAKSSYQDGSLANFKRVKDKYFISKDMQAFELPKNKKDIAKMWPEFETQILSFIKKNKIKTSNENDLIKLISFINSLY